MLIAALMCKFNPPPRVHLATQGWARPQLQGSPGPQQAPRGTGGLCLQLRPTCARPGFRLSDQGPGFLTASRKSPAAGWASRFRDSRKPGRLPHTGKSTNRPQVPRSFAMGHFPLRDGNPHRAGNACFPSPSPPARLFLQGGRHTAHIVCPQGGARRRPKANLPV